MKSTTIGVDVGGSFTDLVWIDGDRVLRSKAPTNPADFGDGVLAALSLVAEQAGVEVPDLLAEVSHFGLGTTAVTNVVAALSGATVGLITTAGFTDELTLSGGIRPSAADGRVHAPVSVVAPERIVGVDERIAGDGEVLRPLDVAEAVAAAERLVAEGADALSVSFVSAYRDPRHEQRAAEAIRARYPDVPLFVGSEAAPTVGFFQRTVYAALNAFSGLALEGVEKFLGRVHELGLRTPVRLVNAVGGATGVAAARRAPMTLMHSGPAAGVSAAAQIARSLGLDKIVACDMGGTSFDVSVVDDGKPLRRLGAEVLEVPTSLAMVDVESIGSGGGSVGWVDARGMLRVGPRSARSVPGPACYGRGGTEPTVTDALLVLGYIDADSFLGGSMRLDRDAAVDACASLGERLDMDAEAVARGIRSLALADMVAAVRMVLNRRGLDSTEYTLVSYGGCAGAFTADIAAALGARGVVAPDVASVLSAYGASTTAVRHERAQSVAEAMPVAAGRLTEIVRGLHDQVLADLEEDGVPGDRRVLAVEADLRYKRQKFELTVPMTVSADLTVAESDVAALEQAFLDYYVSVYGVGASLTGAPVELVTLRVIGTVQEVEGADVAEDVVHGGSTEVVIPVRRTVLTSAGPVEAGVVHDHDLAPGAVLRGPALVTKVDTTLWVPVGASAGVDAAGLLSIDLSEGSVGQTDAPDSVAVELLRTQVQAIADEAADTVERTAISPIVVESQDYGSVLLDADGNLVAGGGQALLHRIGATRAVRATIARYGDTIADGDVYLSNDPHNGGGMHPSDVMVQRPIFVDGVRVGWAALSAHLMDMGGMAVGSWAPHATECFQEALRIPPVRLAKEGVEVSDVWDMFRNNVRFSDLVEMDLRSLIAGSFVAQRKLQALVAPMGAERYRVGLERLIESTAEEMQRRIRQLQPGRYSFTGWSEWGEEFIATPCELTISPEGLHFDFAGAPEQIPFFINSKPYIITTLFMPLLASLMAPDLPYNEGLIRSVTLDCPEGSVVNCRPPAPANCGHMHLGQTAAESMSHCLRLAVLASPQSQAATQLGGFDCQSAHAPNSYWGTMADGSMESWMMFDGLMIGQSASPGRDGVDYTVRPIDLPGRPSSQPTPLDVELYESWYPILMHERGPVPGAYGAGRWRSGASLTARFSPRGTETLFASMLGYRGFIPLPGIAGGAPGRAVTLQVERADGTLEGLAMNDSNVAMSPQDVFRLTNASGGGWGDPADRDAAAVAADVAAGRYDEQVARDVYGVVLSDEGVDAAATATTRDALRQARLAAATTPVREHPADRDGALEGARDRTRPLYVGVVELDGVAYAEESGAALTRAPGHWTDGCPVLETTLDGSPVRVCSYLDPATGRVLTSDVIPPGVVRSFASEPAFWSELSPA